MNCRRALNLVEREKDGSLLETESAGWHAHVSTCEKCREMAQPEDNLTSALSLLGELPDPPSDLHSRVVVALKSDDRWRPMAHRASRRRLARVALAGFTAAMLAFVGLICFRAGVKTTRSGKAMVQQPPHQQDRQASVEDTERRPERTAAVVHTEEIYSERLRRQPIRLLPQPQRPKRVRPWRPGGVATLVSVTGTLSKQDDHHNWVPVVRGTVLQSGELLRSGNSSKARLVLPDSSVAALGANAVLQVRRDCLALFAGKLYASVRPQHRPFAILTPAARVQVLGTRFSVALQRKRRLLVAVFEGTVSVGNGFGAVKVRAGEEAVAEVGSPPAVLSPVKSATMIAIHVEPTSPGGVFEAGEGLPTFSLQVDYNNAAFETLTLRGEVKNDRGERVTEIEEPIATEQFRHTRRPVKIPVTEPGKYQVRFWIEAEDGVAERTVTFAVRDGGETAPRP